MTNPTPTMAGQNAVELVRASGSDRIGVVGALAFDSVMSISDLDETLWTRGAVTEFDLSRVTRSDSAGVALLLEWERQALRAGAGVRYVNVPGQMLSLARLSHLQSVLPLAAS